MHLQNVHVVGFHLKINVTNSHMTGSVSHVCTVETSKPRDGAGHPLAVHSISSHAVLRWEETLLWSGLNTDLLFEDVIF